MAELRVDFEGDGRVTRSGLRFQRTRCGPQSSTKTTGKKSSTRANPRRGKTKEQREAEAQQLHDTLATPVEQLRTCESWIAYLDFLGSFHTYSLNNVLLILAACPQATQVAGFRQWQAKGRQVRKGERAIKIRGYSTKKITQTDAETGEETQARCPRFPVLSVFDISQTDPIQGAVHPEQPATRLTGDDPDGIYATVTAWITDQGWVLEREQLHHGNGYTNPQDRRIVVAAAWHPHKLRRRSFTSARTRSCTPSRSRGSTWPTGAAARSRPNRSPTSSPGSSA